MMRTLLTSLGGIALSLGLLAQAPGPAKTAAALAVLGPQVGQRVPDFRLVDQSGRTRTLTSLLGPKGAMLVFFRSADW
jgi:cytochrome oxidase Cu insertion factor (SCO1/SenC/PrrC family)